MHAVVLAGGYATRLWPITRHRPKMLLPVGETTVIDRILTELEGDDRIENVYLSTNENFAAEFKSHIADEEYEKTTLSIEDTTEESEKFGVMGALAQLVEREGIDDRLLVVAGDNLMGFEMSAFIDYFEERQAPTLAAYDVGSREKAKSYGLLALDGEQVVDVQEKPDNPKSTLVSIACYAFPAESIRFEEYLSGDNNPDEPGWFIEWLQAREDVYAYSFDEAWFDIGTPKSYLEALGWALDGASLVHETADITNCEIGENVQIMADTELTDVTLSNTVVFPHSELSNAELTDTVVDEHVTIDDAVLSDALIGPYSRVS
ncbi:sugar phosphate nucleotidyltransferase [Halocatena pleomorpha]|uniref:NDP-sugar synthase n=1 Tax=Halocatena pleomorpha TaxID=1785090 RepID=A0A3P3R449_9EURY|nr:NDP-sugar synthase [Halocatena pleomorpha]RRJ28256.1 NDP-sugar synthase [Halocatena pleomorpha]